jgi:hypothetical protein
MLEEIDLSGGESVLVQVAGNLFNGRTHIDPLELMRLDHANFEVTIRALCLRRTSAQMSALIGSPS